MIKYILIVIFMLNGCGVNPPRLNPLAHAPCPVVQAYIIERCGEPWGVYSEEKMVYLDASGPDTDLYMYEFEQRGDGSCAVNHYVNINNLQFVYPEHWTCPNHSK